MFKFLSIAVAALFANEAAAFTPAGCTTPDCVIVAVTLCGDPHLVDTAQDKFDVGGECTDVILMDNKDYDELGNDYLMTADIISLGPETSIVGQASLTIGGETLMITKDNELSLGPDDGLLEAFNADPSLSGVPIIIEEKGVEQVGRNRALQAFEVYLEVTIFLGQGVIIFISTQFGAVCIKIVGPFSMISAIVGIFNSGGRRALEGAEQNNLRADEEGRRQLLPDLPLGCFLDGFGGGVARNLKVSNESRDLVAKACAIAPDANAVGICGSLAE